MNQLPGQLPYPISAYNDQNLGMLSQISSMLQANAYMRGTQFAPNSTYLYPQPFTAPNMFGQMSSLAGVAFGPEAGGMMQLGASVITNPALAPYLGPLPGMITAMQNSMPIGGSDPGAFLYSQLQRRLGKSVMAAPQLPNLMSNQRQIDLFNEQMQQMQAFTGNVAPVEQLASFNPNLGAPDSAYGLGVQLANIETLRGSSRFKDVFSLYEAATNQKVSNPALNELMEFARQGTKDSAAKATELLAKSPELKEAAQTVIKNAESAAGFSNTTATLSKMLPQLAQAIGIDSRDPMMQSLMDALSEVSGVKRDPAQFSSAAIQSLSMMGSLGTMTSGQDVMGRPVMAADRITSGILSRIESADSPFSGIRNMGMARAGETMNELAKSGILTSGGVDTFAAIKPEDVKRLEEAIAVQLEGFSEVAAAGKRLGMQIPEIIQSMQRIHRGQFGRALDDAAGRAFEELSSQVGGAGPMDEQTRVFLEAQAQRKAGASMMQQVEKAVQLGRFAGLGAQESMAVLETSAQLTESLGLSGAAGIEMGSAAMARVGLSRTMGRPVTLEQSLAQQRDILMKAQQNSSSRAYASLKLAIDDGVLKADDPQVKRLLDDFNAAKDIAPETVAALISSTGANVHSYVSPEGVAAGMSVEGVGTSINKFFSLNENVSVLGTVKREFESRRIDAEALADKMATDATETLAKAFDMKEEDVAQMDFLGFAANFNKMKNQTERITLVGGLIDKGIISQREGNMLLSTLGSRMDKLDVAGDKGSQRTAAILLEEAYQRQQFGGLTSMEAQAAAVAENQSAISSSLRDSKGNLQVAVSSALESIRNKKIEDYKANHPGVSDEEARKAVGEAGFTFGEILEAASGTSSVELDEALKTRAETLEADEKRFTSAGDKAKAEVSRRALQDIKDIQAIRTAATQEEKDKIRKEIEDRQVPSSVTSSTPTPVEQEQRRAEFRKKVDEYKASNPAASDAEAVEAVKKQFEAQFRDMILPVEATTAPQATGIPPAPATVMTVPAAPGSTPAQIDSSVPPVMNSGSTQSSSSSQVETGASGQSSSESGIMEGPTTKNSESLDVAAKATEADQAIVAIKKTMDDIKLLLASLVKSSQRGADATQATADAISS